MAQQLGYLPLPNFTGRTLLGGTTKNGIPRRFLRVQDEERALAQALNEQVAPLSLGADR